MKISAKNLRGLAIALAVFFLVSCSVNKNTTSQRIANNKKDMILNNVDAGSGNIAKADSQLAMPSTNTQELALNESASNSSIRAEVNAGSSSSSNDGNQRMVASGNADQSSLSSNKGNAIGLAMSSKNNSAIANLIDISVDQVAKGENRVLIAIDKPVDFSLQKTSPSEYILKFNGQISGIENLNPIVVTRNEGNIRAIRPAIGSISGVRIFVNPNVDIEARSVGGDIVIGQAGSRLAFANTKGGNQAGGNNNAEENNEVFAQLSDEEQDESAPEDISEGELQALLGDEQKFTGKKISLDLQDTDIDNALRIIAEVSNLNIITSEDVSGKVTLRLIDVPWDQALDVILKTHGLDMVQEGNVVRIAPIEKLRQEREALKEVRKAAEELEPPSVSYVRVSYAQAAEIAPLVEAVLTEYGSVSYDERTNQLIVKDIKRGIKNAAKLIEKLDLRTPQILLETQIVEAKRTFLRDLGSELGGGLNIGPETGTSTGRNFPNAIDISGGISGTSNTFGLFPAALESAAGSAINFVLDSADGTKALSYRLSALEKEGVVKVISRPTVVTTNNQPATIKSVEKIRVKVPSGGLSVATGEGASAAGSGGIATETIEIGIVLDVTPQASPDYYVLLDIDAKSSTLGTNTVDGIPTEIERRATSTVLVSSGQTFVMGGIYKVSDATNSDGMPFLRDIPFLGHFFRRTSLNNSDEELIFFITPRIVEGSFDEDSMKIK